MTKKKAYPEEMNTRELITYAAFASLFLMAAQLSRWITTDSDVVRFLLDSAIPMFLIVFAINFLRRLNYRKGYEQGRKHERNMQDICMNIKSSIEKKSSNE